MSENYQLIQKTDDEVSPASIKGMLALIRPMWQGKGLIKRVDRLLPVDPSSACQRLFNAAIFDLREKIVTVGVDIAKEVAKTYSLPPVVKDDDILENYSNTNIIDLSYRIGLLQRPEWRRIQRCYEIRKDLEHEDNEYEAVLEDCFYIFKSTIEIVLSQDPVELLKVVDVKQDVEKPVRITITEELLQNYDHAPELRQKEILSFLVATARNSTQPDIVRDNSFELLRHFRTRTKTPVIIEIAKNLEDKLAGKPIDLFTAKVGNATGATAYFKRTRLKDYYNSILDDFKQAGTEWEKQTKLTYLFEDIGSFSYSPAELKNKFIKYLVIWYIGEPGGYGYWGTNRQVFNSDAAAPIIVRIFKNAESSLVSDIEKLRQDKEISGKLSNRHILNRFENLLDYSGQSKND
jgi:hypothetical protein